MRPIFTLTTDFGTDSPYVAQMKGVLLSLQPQAVIVDVTHAIPPQDICAGALALDEVCFRFPKDSIHIAVVDPGVGTARELIYARIGGQHFLAPDNGLLGVAAARVGVEELRVLTNRELWASDVSHTFHGRDILAPVAARLSLGMQGADLGPLRENWVKLELPQVMVGEREMRGEVIGVDSFGNLLTNVSAKDMISLKIEVANAWVRFAGRKIAGVVRTYGERLPGEVVALMGSSGRLEIAVVNGSAASVFQGRRGNPVSVEW